jgi:type IV pilus assembly protein PilA
VAPSGRRSNRLIASEGARRRRAGFTLVEVIVVLVILAILAAIAIPALTGYIDKANTSQIKAKARTAAVAMQTILSEAYADPQTQLPPGGALYIDGKYIAQINTPDSDGMYSLSDEQEVFIDLFRKLDASSIITQTVDDNKVEMLAMNAVGFDEHFSLLAYLYYDPDAYKAGEYRLCTYNYRFPEGTNNLVYDPSAGFKIWGVENNLPVPLG